MMSSTLVGSEGQGIRTAIAHQSKPQFQGNNNAFYSAHFSNFAAAATSNNTHNENLSAPPSSSASSSMEGGNLNFFPLHSSMENASPAFLGLEKTRQKMSVSEVSMGRVMGITSNNGEGIASSNPFDSDSSFVGFLSSTDAFNTPQKSTPLGGAETFRLPSSTGKVLGSSARPRLVKVRRNNSGADVGKSPAAFSGGNLKKGSLDDEVPGYNPFRSDKGNVLRTVCLEPFSKGIGDNVVNQGFKPRHNVGMKEFSISLNKENDDLNDQMRSWKPIVGSSEVKSSGGDASINSFSFSKKFESVGFTFKAGIDDKAAKSSVAKEGSNIGAGLGLDFQFSRASENVHGVRKVNDIKYDGSFSFGNDAQQANERKMADAHPQGQKSFVFNAVPKPKRRIGYRHRQQELRSNAAGDAISSRTIHGSSSCGQSTIDNLLQSQSSALKNRGQSSIDDSFSFQSSGLKAGGGQSTFDSSLSFNSSGLRNGGPSTFDTSFVSESSTFGTSFLSQPSWLKNGGQSTFATSFVSQKSLAKSDDMKKNAPFVSPTTVSGSGILQSNGVINLDNPFASQTPQSVTNNASYSGINSFGYTGGKPNSSTFIFNAGGKVESESDEIPKPNHSGEVGGIPSSVEGPTSRASSPEKDNSWPSMESLSSSFNQICGFNADKGVSQNSSARKKRDKSQLPSMRRKLGKHSTSKNSKRFTPIAFQANSTEGGSPMDFSPYSETSASATCKGKSPADNDNIPDLGQSSVAWATPVHCSLQTSYDLHESLEMKAKVDELRAAAANLHIGADKETSPKTCKQEESSKGEEHHDSHTGNRIDEARQHAYNNIDDKEKTSFSESDWLNSRMEKIKIDDGENVSIHCSESEWLNSKMEKVRISDGANTRISPSESEWPNSRMEKIRIDDSGNTYCTLKAGESYQNKQFTFGASSSVNPTPPSRLRRHVRRFHQVKGGENLCASNSEVKFGMPYCATHPRGLNSQDALWKGGEELEGICNPGKVSGEPTISYIFSSLPKEEGEGAASSRSVKSAAAEEACEKWRLRGNQAYANGDFPKAEDCYSRGASSVSPNETSESCIRASMLCYSNRAATRMAVGRMREALADCMHAMAIDPNFLRVQIRAASCHLFLGESESAVSLFKRCLRSANDIESLDLKIASEASNGLRKAQQGWEYTDRAADILDKSNPGDASNALHILNEALSISPYSDRLLGLKALCLLNLRKYEEVIQVCEQSMDSAERNCCLSNSDSQLGSESLGNMAMFPIKLWRWRMSAKAYFHLGKLEEALDLLVKYEELNSAVEKSGKQSQESLASFMAMIRDLLRHKAAGNNAFQAGKHAEAVEHYTAALACNGESWPFTAVCFCNRAAAFQALGHVVDAIADCSRAIALDPNYPKAISRRATLHEMVRDYGQAATDLERLITLLEKQQRRKGSSSNNKEIFRQTRERLAKAEEEMKRGHPFDHYLILGVEASSTGAEIKKAYRKAALRHHPDKAGHFLVRSDSGDDSKWRELGDEVRRDAERLFKMIGEAYAILSDSCKRLRYDTEEELRKLRIRGNSTGSETMPEACRYQSEKGNRRQRDRWDSWDGYSNFHQRWQSGPDAAQPDTYARRGSYKKGSNDGSWSTDWDYL